MFSKDPAIVNQDWSAADPLVWCPSLAKLASVMNVNPGQNRPVVQGNGFAPITIGGKNTGKPFNVKGQTQGHVLQPPNVFSNAQFPPLGAPPPPPAQQQASSSSSAFAKAAAAAVQQSPVTASKAKKRKNTSLFPTAATQLFQSDEETQAKLKRARRFEREIELDKQREANGGWGDEDEEDTGGMGWVGYDGQEPEADPVSPARRGGRWLRRLLIRQSGGMAECD